VQISIRFIPDSLKNNLQILYNAYLSDWRTLKPNQEMAGRFYDPPSSASSERYTELQHTIARSSSLYGSTCDNSKVDRVDFHYKYFSKSIVLH
jgi:hypothetical protein